MEYHKSLKLCHFVGALTGIAPSSDETLTRDRKFRNKTGIILQRAIQVYPLLITCFILLFNVDLLFQRYPSSNRNQLSDWILSKGKDGAFTVMGSGLIVSSLLLRKSIKILYHLMSEYSLRYHLKTRQEFGSLNTISLVLMLLHSFKVVIEEAYDTIWRWEEKKGVKRILLPFHAEGSWESYYVICTISTVSNTLQIIHQGCVTMFLVTGASFISDAFKSLESDIEHEIQLKSSFQSHLAVAAKIQSYSKTNDPWMSHPHTNGRLTILKEKWDRLVKIYEVYELVGGVYLSIMFPGTSMGFVARLGAGILNALNWEWHTHGSRVYSGLVCFFRTFLLIEIGHRFKTEIMKSQDKLRKSADWNFNQEDKYLRALINEILNTKWSLTALGFFECYRGITTSVISTSMTYFVIIFQLRSTEKH